MRQREDARRAQQCDIALGLALRRTRDRHASGAAQRAQLVREARRRHRLALVESGCRLRALLLERGDGSGPGSCRGGANGGSFALQHSRQ